MRFISIKLNLQEGDIITSKKGILVQSPVTNEKYMVKKIRIIGKDCFESKSEKISLKEKGKENGKSKVKK